MPCASKRQPQKHASPPVTREEIERLREQVSRLVAEKPEKAAIILTEWVRKSHPSVASQFPNKKKAG